MVGRTGLSLPGALQVVYSSIIRSFGALQPGSPCYESAKSTIRYMAQVCTWPVLFLVLPPPPLLHVQACCLLRHFCM